MDLRDRLAENPFFVLGLTATCGRADVEREGQKLLGLLALGTVRAGTYETPFGPRERTADLVRQAMAELRDPRKRVLHEIWSSTAPSVPGQEGDAPWTGAFAALGIRALR